MLADNIVQFARLLRTVGVAVDTVRVLKAVEAIEAVGLERRHDVHAALSAVMLERHEQQTVFDAAFDAFWRDPQKGNQRLPESLLGSSDLSRGGDSAERPAMRRPRHAADGPAGQGVPSTAPPEPDSQIELEASFRFSALERLQRRDFSAMTNSEFELAKKLAEEVPLPFTLVRRRRHAASARGQVDLRATCLAWYVGPRS